MTLITVRLPWPVAGLWRNTEYRNRYALTKAKRKQRGDAKVLTLEQMQGKSPPAPKRGDVYHLTIFAYPPNPRNYDDDNLIASIKAARDGIADALQVDDNLFKLKGVEWGPATRGGRIDVTLTLARCD